MAAVVSWYGPLIDLSEAAVHVGGLVQLLASVRRVLPHQEQNAATGRTYQRTMLEVGDDTRSSFCVSLWAKHSSSTMVAGDVLLLQNIKIVEFRNGLEGRASQISAVQLLLSSKDLVQPKGKVQLAIWGSLFILASAYNFPEQMTVLKKVIFSLLLDNLERILFLGIDDLIINCKVGNATRSKLRRVADWILHAKCILKGNGHQAMPKNWKERRENELAGFLSISELLSRSKLCNVNVYASIGKIVLMDSMTSHLKGKLLVIERFSLKEHNGIVRDFITTGCKLCGLPLYPKNLHGESTCPIDCPNNPKYLHVLGQIYNPFMIYVRDQCGQVPLLVRNKAAEILFANIMADDVSECYKRRHCMLIDTCDSGTSSTSRMLDSTSMTGTTKRKRTKEKPDFHLIWLILIKCILNQGKNSPFCFQISVNPEKNVENGRFELISLTMPIP